MKTTQEQFIRRYGTPERNEQITDKALPGTCYRLTYPWGEARFYVAEKGTLLYYISTTSNMAGPRNTRVGMQEAQITEKFKDMGQKPNQDGSRSLYNDSGQKCYGKVNLLENGQKRIDYWYVDKEYEATITLSYYLTNGVCTRIVNSFMIN